MNSPTFVSTLAGARVCPGNGDARKLGLTRAPDMKILVAAAGKIVCNFSLDGLTWLPVLTNIWRSLFLKRYDRQFMEWVDEGKIDFSSFGRFISLAEPNGKPRIYPIPKLLYKPSQTKVVLNFKCVVYGWREVHGQNFTQHATSCDHWLSVFCLLLTMLVIFSVFI